MRQPFPFPLLLAAFLNKQLPCREVELLKSKSSQIEMSIECDTKLRF